MQKATISFIMSVHPSVRPSVHPFFWLYVRPFIRMEQMGSHWTDFYAIWYLNIFRKSEEKIQISLKSDKNNELFSWILLYIYDHI